MVDVLTLIPVLHRYAAQRPQKLQPIAEYVYCYTVTTFLGFWSLLQGLVVWCAVDRQIAPHTPPLLKPRCLVCCRELQKRIAKSMRKGRLGYRY